MLIDFIYNAHVPKTYMNHKRYRENLYVRPIAVS